MRPALARDAISLLDIGFGASFKLNPELVRVTPSVSDGQQLGRCGAALSLTHRVSTLCAVLDVLTRIYTQSSSLAGVINMFVQHDLHGTSHTQDSCAVTMGFPQGIL